MAEPREVHRPFMEAALEEARRAGTAGEVPVGAVVVLGGVVVGRGCNCPIATRDPTAHAEVRALRDAAQRVRNYRLSGAALYATVEPCLMCVGACFHARVAQLVFGATDAKAGAVVSRPELFEGLSWSRHVRVTGGVLAEEAGRLVQDFFRVRRAEGYRSGRTGLDSKSSWG
jgi:tRNA(adenine34) deaminase